MFPSIHSAAQIVRSWFTPRKKQPMRKDRQGNRTFRPWVEELETRLVPAVISYVDFNNFDSASAANVTTVTGSVVGPFSGALKDFATGSATGVTVSVSAGSVLDPFNAGAHPTGGDALAAFGATANGNGILGPSDGVTTQTITLTGLTDNTLYELVIYSNRDFPSGTRLNSYTLAGVDSFTNSSSAGTFSGPTSNVTTIDIMNNSLAGKIARFTNVDPGSDGTLTVTVANAGGTNQAIQVNMMKLITPTVPAIPTVTTFASVTNPVGVAFDAAGTMHVSSAATSQILRVNSSGVVTTFATTVGFPERMDFDSNGDLYVADGNNGTRIDKVTPTGVVTQFGPVINATHGLTFDSANNLYVVAGNTDAFTQNLSKITPGGVVTVLATSAQIGYTQDVAIDAAGANLYIASWSSGRILKYNLATNTLTTFASGLGRPNGLAFDTAGNLYVSDSGANRIMKVTSSGTVSTFVSSGLNQPYQLAFDSAGILYVADNGTNTIKKITLAPANTPPTIASNAAAVSADEGGTATNAGTFNDAQGRSTVTITASIGTVTQNNTLGTWSWSLNAADGPAGPVTVTITATDAAAAAATTTFTYAINNVPPTISLSGNATVNEGSPYTLNLGAVSDPGVDTITSYRVNWGDGSFDVFTGSPANTTATHTYADGPATQTHNVTVTDGDGTFIAGSLSVQVLNVAPTATLQTNSGVTYGNSATASLIDALDPSTADTTAGFHYAFSIDTDTTGSATYATSGTSNSTDFGVLNAGDHTVYARIIDKDGGFTAYTATLTINKAEIDYTIGNASHVYGSTVNLATALGATINTGVNGENLAIAYSSTGNTVLANAGSYGIDGVVTDGTGLASNYTVTLTPGTLTVTQATLTGDATTQDALNMAKQGLLKITVSNVAGLLNGDTLATFLATAEYYITVGANQYVFVPTTVTTSGSSITISYTLKNSALQSQLAAELADNTSGATAATAGFFMESLNYTFTDEYLTRLFSTVK